jgi:hypothetical protein
MSFVFGVHSRTVIVREGMRNRICSVSFVSAVLLCAAFLAGCANLPAVRTYADETKKLSAAFEPMLAGSTSSCVEKFKRKKMITSRNFDAIAAEQAARSLCGSIDEDNKIIADLNSLLEQYADTLAALANEKLPSYKKELDGLKDSLSKVKRPGTQDSLINDEKLTAIASLADVLSRIVTQHMQKVAIRELLNHEKAIVSITDALKEYSTLNYRGWLKNEKDEIAVLRKSLNDTAKTEPLFSNYLETLLLTEEKQIDVRDKLVDAFVKSVDKLQKSHSELLKNFDTLDNKELLAQLIDFENEVSKLRKQVRDAF